MTLDYRNPDLPEGINASEEHPLKEFALLVAGIFGSAALVLVLLVAFAGYLARFVPFSAEQKLAMPFARFDDRAGPMQKYLQQLADRVAHAENLPPGMTIRVHYVDSDTVNAMATLGGNVVFFRGLLEKMPNENALAMVMAHEIAHVRTRAPIEAMGRGVVLATVLSVVDHSLGTALAGSIMGQAGLLTELRFSRGQESEADRLGEAAVAKLYGGTAGVDPLFRILDRASRCLGQHQLELYSSHPAVKRRLRALHEEARDHGWPVGKATPLPQAFSRWLGKGPGAGKACAG